MDIEIKDLRSKFIRYCSLEENLSPKTISGINSSLNAFFARTGIVNLNEVTLEKLRNFFYEGKEKHCWSESTTINYIKYLKKFFNWCIGQGYLTQNLVLQIKRPKLPQPLPRVLTKDQAHKLLNASLSYNWHYQYEKYRNYCMISTLLFTGIRAAELLNLRYEDVNLISERIFIRSGKNRKDRYVPIYKKLRSILETYIHERKRLNKTSVYFFTGVKGDLPLSYKDLARVCRKLSKFIQIKFTPHVCRHTAATELINGGMDIYMVGKLLGHEDIKTTTIYLHTATKNLQQSMDGLDMY